MTKPVFIDTVTHIEAEFANGMATVLYDIFDQATTKTAAREALGFGTIAMQDADAVQIVGGSINNTPIGLTTPQQGVFSVLSIIGNPIAPEHGVNRRYLTTALANLGSQYLSTGGGTVTGPINLTTTPSEPSHVVDIRWVNQQLVTQLAERPLQRKRLLAQSGGQQSFPWPDFVRTADVVSDNFLVFVNGVFQQLGPDYTFSLTPVPTALLNAPVAENTRVDMTYITNLRNLLSITPPPPQPEFDAGPGWADPVNMRTGYSRHNSGQNAVSQSSTVLRELFLSCIVSVGQLNDRVVSWAGQWLAGNPGSVGHSPTITRVSQTEAKVSLPDAVTELYWEGRYEIRMLLDGVPTTDLMWIDLNNQVVGNLTDGIVRWGIIGQTSPEVDVNLEITKTCNKTEVEPAESLVYTITAANIGTTAANNSLLTDVLPTNFVATSITPVYANGGGGPTFITPTTLAAGIALSDWPALATLTLTITGSFTAAGSYTNTASIAPPFGRTGVTAYDTTPSLLVYAPPTLVNTMEDNVAVTVTTVDTQSTGSHSTTFHASATGVLALTFTNANDEDYTITMPETVTDLTLLTGWSEPYATVPANSTLTVTVEYVVAASPASTINFNFGVHPAVLNVPVV